MGMKGPEGNRPGDPSLLLSPLAVYYLVLTNSRVKTYSSKSGIFMLAGPQGMNE